ncbi:MAG: hypothetical protein U0168_17745 [Nannocystaceae bacterium]
MIAGGRALAIDRRRTATAGLAAAIAACTPAGGVAPQGGSSSGTSDAAHGDTTIAPGSDDAGASTHAGSDEGSSDDGGTTGEPLPPPMPPPRCAATTTGPLVPTRLPDDYGFAPDPPTMALADTAYVYDVHTNIGACATDRVRWTLHQGPAGVTLAVGDAVLEPGESVQHEDGGAARERASLAWILEDVEPGCHALELRWQPWRDCGALDDGAWGPELSQRFELAVRENHWYSGDLHVHTRHSERDDDAGGAQDYYERMVNLASNDSGLDFADRRTRSLRGRLHWLVFSDHSNNELDECGRHFAPWCGADEPLAVATGRDVVRALTEADPSVLLVVGGEISNRFDGHLGFLPRNPFPGHPQYAPEVLLGATDYDHDAGFGPGVFRERWVDAAATNDEEIALVHAMGGLAIVNHESAPTFWIEYDWSSLAFDGLEVWNGGNRHDRDDDDAYHGGIALGDVTQDDRLQTELPEEPLSHSWVGMLKQGRWPMVLTGGSDVHDFAEVVCEGGPCDPTNAELASPTTSVWARRFVWHDGEHGVFDGLAAGRVVVHDRSNFIDLRVLHDDAEAMVGDTIAGYEPGSALQLRAFGHVADFVDGDNRVLLLLGTSGDPDDRRVDVLYSSEDDTHFVAHLQGKDHMRYLRPDSSFDRSIEIALDASQLGESGSYFVWAQFVPWHNPLYLFGNGQDMALTGAVRITIAP